MKDFSIMDSVDAHCFVRALEKLGRGVGELRRIALSMIPDAQLSYGLRTTLEDFCRKIPKADFQYYGENPRLDIRLERLIYRCVYELVNNAVEYSDATKVNIQLIVDDGLISLTVQDNGRGYDPGSAVTCSGTENIRKRISAYGGRVMIHTSPGNGAEISIEIENS